MATPKRTVLGVEIGSKEIRIMEMKGGGPEAQIQRAGSVPLPNGAMDGDRIAQVEVVADLLKGLLARLGCQSKQAVVGMGLQNVVTRILAVPRVPDSELRTVIEGELAHYQILRAGMGAFDFFRLDAANAAADAPPSVLLMAVEDSIARGYRQAVERAGLQMIALEPVTLALFRAAYPRLQAEPAALCLAVTHQRSELSILDQGQIRLYRRLDIGSNDFIVGRRGPTSAEAPGVAGGGAPGAAPEAFARPTGQMLAPDEGTGDLNPEPFGSENFPGIPDVNATLPGAEVGEIIPQAAASLANEVQKTLDYYRREFPSATPISRIVLATNDPDAEGLSEWLAHALRLEVTVANNPTTPNLPPATAQQLEPPGGLRFLGAAGLALHALTPDWKQVPSFNIATGGKSAQPGGAERDRLTYSMVASVCLLLAGGIWVFWNYNETGKVKQQIVTTRAELNEVKKQEADAELKVSNDRVLRAIVQSDGLPIAKMCDVIASAVPPEVGLTQLNIDRRGKITIEGKAVNYDRYFTFTQLLEKCSSFTPPKPIYVTVPEQTLVVSFRVDLSLVGTHAAIDIIK